MGSRVLSYELTNKEYQQDDEAYFDERMYKSAFI